MQFWVILAAVMLFLSWTHAAMYKFGKRMALNLIEQHCIAPRQISLEKALQYERDVMEGKVPRG